MDGFTWFTIGWLGATAVAWFSWYWNGKWGLPGWLRALRRSEPRPKTTLRYGRITSKQELPPLVFPDEYYDPQPTSPPPSEASTGLTSGQSERPSASRASTPQRQDVRENED